MSFATNSIESLFYILAEYQNHLWHFLKVQLIIEQLTDSKLGKEYNKAAYCHPVHLISMQSTSGEGNGTPLQYSCLENPMDGGAWWAAVHGVARSQTRLSDFTFTFHFYALEKEMATHSSVLAWIIPGMWEPGGLRSMGSHRVGHD